MTTTATAEPAPPAPAQIEWNLAEIYDSLDAWREDKARLEARVKELARFKGRLGESAAVLSEALDAISSTEKDLVRLYVFAFLKADEDRRVSEAQERRGEATLLLAAFEEATSFVSPELLRVGSVTIEGYLNAEPRACPARLQRPQHPAQGAAHAVRRGRGGHRGHERHAAGGRSGCSRCSPARTCRFRRSRCRPASRCVSTRRPTASTVRPACGPTGSWYSTRSGAPGGVTRRRWGRPSTRT